MVSTSRFSIAELDGLAVHLERLLLGHLQARLEAGFLRSGRAVFGLDRAHDVPHLVAQLLFRRANRVAHADQIGMLVAQGLRELGVLLLKIGQLGLQALDDAVADDQGEALELTRPEVPHLVQERLLADALRAGREDRRREGGELLIDQALTLLEVEEAFLLPVGLQRLLGRSRPSRAASRCRSPSQPVASFDVVNRNSRDCSM